MNEVPNSNLRKALVIGFLVLAKIQLIILKIVKLKLHLSKN